MPLTAASKRRAIKVALLGLVGLTIATYALSVETQMHEPGYEAACDIGAGFSCTAVFSSEYAHPLSHWGLVKQGDALDIGLAVAGMALYSAYFVAACLWRLNLVPYRQPLFLAVATAGACFSCYLLYVLKFILGDFCIVCTGFHCVNFSMFAVALFEFFDSGTSGKGSKRA
mmetsp:Transcript_18561/g.54541  ORF Transcript_18561/g.54541 Transcript_18561/m.54541 type:complete len:171 (-) Transcript_18561:178-690(-)